MKRSCLLLPIALSLGLSAMDVGADTWPTKPMKAIVPIAAGSVIDIVPRVVFAQLGKQLGQTIVVENRPRRGADRGRRRRCEGGPRRLHPPRQLGGARHRAVATSEPRV